MTGGLYDAAIVGGGPAGACAAWGLANRGWRVALFEAQRFPHDKLCGEFLSPECLGLLTMMGINLGYKELGAAPIHQVGFTAPDGSRWQATLHQAALGISRRLFDALLIDQVRLGSAEVYEGCQVVGIEGDLSKGFRLAVTRGGKMIQVEARAVIGAQGKRSRIDAHLHRSFFTLPAPFVAMKSHFQDLCLPGRIELYTFPGGYCGMSEIEGNAANVCLLVRQEVFKQAAQGNGPPTQNFFRWLLNQNSRLREQMEASSQAQEHWITIAQVSFGSKPCIDRDVLMVGDAAGLIAPLVGDGIGMAIESAQIASEMLSTFLEGKIPAQTLRHKYPTSWRDHFSLRLRLGGALQPWLLHPGRAGLAFRLLSRLPGVGQFLISNTRGKVRSSGHGRMIGSV